MRNWGIIKMNYQARWDIWSEILSESDNGWNKVPCSPTVPCLPRTETVEWRKFRWSYMGPGTLNKLFKKDYYSIYFICPRVAM